MRFLRSARILFLLVAFALIALHLAGILAPVERAIASISRPIQKTVSGWFLADDVSSQPGTLEEAQDRVTRLLIENAQLKEERSQLLAALEHQDVLKERNLSGIFATIIGKSPEGDAHVAVLDRGTEQGVQVGQPVIASGGILVGTVREAGPGRSLLLLLTDTTASVAAEVQNEERSPGIVVGKLGLSMTMGFIPQQEPVALGQLVVTAALNEYIPAGLLIGQITAVDMTAGELFQSATVTPLLDVQRLRYVTILSSP